MAERKVFLSSTFKDLIDYRMDEHGENLRFLNVS